MIWGTTIFGNIHMFSYWTMGFPYIPKQFFFQLDPCDLGGLNFQLKNGRPHMLDIRQVNLNHPLLYWYIYIYTWNRNDPCFDCKRPCFGDFNHQNRGQTGSRYIYIYLHHPLIYCCVENEPYCNLKQACCLCIPCRTPKQIYGQTCRIEIQTKWRAYTYHVWLNSFDIILYTTLPSRYICTWCFE